MRRRTFEEMITYFNHTVSEMDIDRKHKMTLLGIVTALLQKHDEDVAQIVRCKDCKHWIPYDWMFSEVWQSKNIADYPEDEIGCNFCDVAMKANDFCSRGERRTDE